MITVVNAQFFGGDKEIKELVDQPSYKGVEYVLYTNKPEVVEGTNWRAVEMSTDNPRMTARDIKINIHKYHPDSSHWFWIDANMKIEVDPNLLINKYLGRHDVCLMPHPERHHWVEEAQFLLDRDPNLEEPIQELINQLYAEGFASTTLYETGVLLRLNTAKVIAMNKYWWEKVSEVCIRDQISFPYAAWKAGLAVNTFPGTNSINPLRFELKRYLPQWKEVIRAWN